MNFLAFVDLHDNKKALKELISRAGKNDVDFIVCAGDLSNFGRGLIDVLEAFKKIGKKLYLIPGNHEESKDFNEILQHFPLCENIHRKALVIDNHIFLGYGGDGFSQEDPEFRKIAREWYGTHKGKKIVLITHGPPFGTKLDWFSERFVGNKDYRNFIERIHPQIVICGHLHENAGLVDNLGETKLINPGWEGMVISLK